MGFDQNSIHDDSSGRGKCKQLAVSLSHGCVGDAAVGRIAPGVGVETEGIHLRVRTYTVPTCTQEGCPESATRHRESQHEEILLLSGAAPISTIQPMEPKECLGAQHKSYMQRALIESKQEAASSGLSNAQVR